MNPQHAVEAPRFATFSFPSSFRAVSSTARTCFQLEGRIERRRRRRSIERGHDVKCGPTRLGGRLGLHDPPRLGSGIKSAGADFRRTAYAVGWCPASSMSAPDRRSAGHRYRRRDRRDLLRPALRENGYRVTVLDKTDPARRRPWRRRQSRRQRRISHPA